MHPKLYLHILIYGSFQNKAVYCNNVHSKQYGGLHGEVWCAASDIDMFIQLYILQHSIALLCMAL